MCNLQRVGSSFISSTDVCVIWSTIDPATLENSDAMEDCTKFPDALTERSDKSGSNFITSSLKKHEVNDISTIASSLSILQTRARPVEL